MRCAILLLLLVLGAPAGAASLTDIRSEGFRLFDRAGQLRALNVPLPPDLLPAATTAISANDAFSAEELRDLETRLALLSGALDELELDPGLAGTLALPDAGSPFEAGGEVTLQLVYTPNRDLPPGAEIIVDTQQVLPGVIQNLDPASRNHIEIGVEVGAAAVANTGFGADADAVFEPIVDIRRALAGSLDGDEVRAAFRLTEGVIFAGTPVAVTLSRLELPTFAYGRLPLNLRVRLEAGGYAYPVAPAEISLAPQRTDSIAVFAPQEVASDERVPVTVRVLDRFGNLVAGRIPPFDVMVDGQFRGRIASGDDPTPLLELDPLALGTHVVEVRSAGGGLRAETLVRSSALPSRVRWIEPRASTEASGSLLTEPEVRGRFLGISDALFIKESDDQLDAQRWRDRRPAGIDGFIREANVRAGGRALVLTNGPMGPEPPRLRFPTGNALRELPDDALVAALPEVPMDHRLRDPKQVRLVEILAGASLHEWYGQLIAGQGSQIGFIASSASSDRGADAISTAGRTAVRLRPGETTFAALAAGRTWVTSGPRIFLDVETNGATPGGRAPAAVNRVVQGEVRGTAPIERIELVRNGETIAVRDYSVDPDSPTVQVAVESDVAPRALPDLPRNGREWIGYVSLQGGSITEVDDSNLRREPGKAAVVNPRAESRVDFITWTRGLRSSFTFDYSVRDESDEDVERSREPELEVVLRRGTEDMTQKPLYREPAEIPPATLVVGLGELYSGPVVREYDVEGYRDRVTLKLVNTDLPGRVSFEFLDRRVGGQGDYYYVRVIQTDDHVAISSPMFVGGFDPE